MTLAGNFVTKSRSVCLPASCKANTREAGADIKKSGLFSGAHNLKDGGLTS